jgi:hypothetical protein
MADLVRVEEDEHVLTQSVTRGTPLIHVPVEQTEICANPAFCLSSSAYDGNNARFLMMVEPVLPASYSLPDRWTEPMTRGDIGALTANLLTAVSSGLQAATTMLVRTNDGHFYEAASRDLEAGMPLKRYARTLEHLMPLLETYPVSSGIYVESVLQRVLPLEIEIMANWQLPVFGPVAWRRQLPPVITLQDGRLVCPYENNAEPSVNQCLDYLIQVYGEHVTNARAHSALRVLLQQEEESSADDEGEDSDY